MVSWGRMGGPKGGDEDGDHLATEGAGGPGTGPVVGVLGGSGLRPDRNRRPGPSMALPLAKETDSARHRGQGGGGGAPRDHKDPLTTGNLSVGLLGPCSTRGCSGHESGAARCRPGGQDQLLPKAQRRRSYRSTRGLAALLLRSSAPPGYGPGYGPSLCTFLEAVAVMPA